jgi:hypothetical protein
MRYLLVTLLAPVLAAANIGGVFHSPSVFGMALDSTSISKAHVAITCAGAECAFKTVYTCTDTGKSFAGYFYGDRVGDVKMEGGPVDASWMEGYNAIDPAALKRFDAPLSGLENRLSFRKTKVSGRISAESTLTVTGRLRPDNGQYWGLAMFSHWSDARHPLLSRYRPNDLKKAVYLISPIQAFDSLRAVRLEIRMRDAELLGVQADRGYLESPRKDGLDTTFTHGVPRSVSLVFRRKPSGIPWSWGGPLGYLGSRDGGMSAEIGWELGFPALAFGAVLPSVNYAFTRKAGRGPNLGLRFSYYGFLIAGGQFLPQEREFIPVLGLDLADLGVEFRSNGILMKFSL